MYYQSNKTSILVFFFVLKNISKDPSDSGSIGGGSGGGSGGSGGTGGGSGGSIGGNDGEINTNPFENNDTNVMYVTSTSTGPVYLRSISFGDYIKSGFSGNVPVYTGDYTINPLYLSALILKEAGYTESDILVEMVSLFEGYKLPSYTTNAPAFTDNDYQITIDFDGSYELKYILFFSIGKKLQFSLWIFLELMFFLNNKDSSIIPSFL